MKAATRALVVVVAVVAAGIGIWSCQGAMEEERFEERVDRLRSAGAPVEASEMARPRVPPERDAAPLLQRALLLSDEKDSTRFFELLHDAARRPDCWYPLIMEPRYGRQLASSKVAVALINWMNWRVQQDVSPAELADDLAMAWRVFEFVERWSLLASSLHWSGRTHVCRWLLELPAEFVARDRFEALLREAEDGSRLEEALAGARVGLIWSVRSVASGESPMRVRLAGKLGIRVDAEHLRAWIYRDGLRMLNQMSELIEFVAQASASELARRDGPSINDGPVGRLLHGHIVVAEKALHERVKYLACTRMARVVLAARLRKRTTGEWPATLGELAPLFPDGIPLDPYSELPFRYDPGKRIASAAPGIQPIAFELQ